MAYLINIFKENYKTIQNESSKKSKIFKNNNYIINTEPNKKIQSNYINKTLVNSNLLLNLNENSYNNNETNSRKLRSPNIIPKLLKEKNKVLKDKKYKIINKRNLYQDKDLKLNNINLKDFTKNTLLESIKESNCDSTTINNNENETNNNDYNNDLKYKFIPHENNLKQKSIQKHNKHNSDIIISIDIEESDINKFQKTNNLQINKNINKKGVINKNEKGENNIKCKRKKLKEKNKFNKNFLFDKNNILKDINSYEINIINSINNIFSINQNLENFMEPKFKNKILNLNANKNKAEDKKEKSFINNFNSDYSFESEDFKKNYIGAKIINCPINNIFKDISFNSLTNSSESFSLNDENNGEKHKVFKNNNINYIVDKNDKFIIKKISENKKFNYIDKNNSKDKRMKRNISENILKDNQKTKNKKFNDNKINSVLNNKIENINTSINSTNQNNSKYNRKKKKLTLNESIYKLNMDKIYIQKKIDFTNYGKNITKIKKKICINDNILNTKKKKEKIINEKGFNKLSINDTNFQYKKRNSKFNSINSIDYFKYSIDKNIKTNMLKSKSTSRKKKANHFSLNNAHKIKNKSISNNSLISFTKYSNLKKPIKKCYKKITEKLFTPDNLANIKKRDKKFNKNKIFNTKNKNETNLYNLFSKDYISKYNISSSIGTPFNNSNNIDKNKINLKQSLYYTISKTKFNSIYKQNGKIMFNTISNSKRNYNNNTCSKKNFYHK